MKTNRLFLCLATASLLFGCSGNNNNSASSSSSNNSIDSNSSLSSNEKTKIKVIYFSCTNTTEKVANKISNYLNCNIEEIIPSVPYSSDDLNYNSDSSRANIEQNDVNARPEIKNTINIDDTNVIFLGYPIWWGRLPKIIYTFFDTYDFNNYTIVPFCTSGGSGISTSVNEIKQLEPNARVLEGRKFNSNASDSDVKSFVDSLNI